MSADIKTWEKRLPDREMIMSCEIEMAMLGEITDLRAALAARPVILPGYALVPLEPTPKMVDATFTDDLRSHSHNKRNKHIYRAMLAAAPKVAP
ncbi:hypothetical protein ACFDR9_001601 [Janthinobacterium sp. CG_23.3]|uniref:hypothetical protein n=1 Tax=Janthinobacterium sp. CG_23.3 TaxID=3349634 RepID=UPI0038D49263